MNDKFKLTQEQILEIQQLRENNPVCRYLDMMENCKFSIGDILVKYSGRKDWNNSGKIRWELEMLSPNSTMPKRYVYVYEDKHGVGFVKRLNIKTGELCKETICLADVVGTHSNLTKFQVDPEYMDSVLLGDGSFDIKKLHKQSLEKKQRVKELNKSAAFVSSKLSEVNNFLSQIKAGDTLYYSRNKDYSGNCFRELKVDKMAKSCIARLDQYTKQHYTDVVNSGKFIIDDNKVYRFIETNIWVDDSVSSLDFLDTAIWLNKPIELKDNVV
jgi:hypothetical protein